MLEQPARIGSYAWYVILLLGLVNAINYMDRMALAVLSPLIKADLGLSDSQLGLLIGLAFSLFYAVCGIPIARWADRGNRRNIIALAIAVWSVMTALSGAAQNFWHLLAARIGIGAGEAGSISPGASVLCDYVALERRPIALGALAFGSAVGILSGMAIAGWLGEAIGWRLAFLALGAPGILLAVLVRLTLREPRRGALDSPVLGDSTPSLRTTIQLLWRCRTYRALVLFLVANGFVQYGLNQWWPSFYTRSFALGTASVGLSLGISVGACSGLGVLAGSLMASYAARRDVRLPLQISAAFNALSIPAVIGSLFISSFVGSIVLVSLAAFCWGVSNGPALAAQYSVVTPQIRATAGAIAVFLTSVFGFGLGPWLVGLLSDALAPALGSESLRYALLLPTSAGSLVVGALLLATRSLADDLPATGASERHGTSLAA